MINVNWYFTNIFVHTATVEETGNDDKECNTNQSENNIGQVINNVYLGLFNCLYL